MIMECRTCTPGTPGKRKADRPPSVDPRIKIDLNAVLKTGNPVILELGCGQGKKPDHIGIDIVDLPHVDIVADLEDGLSFLPSDSVDVIHANSILEHIRNFEGLLREITRVLRKGGQARIFVPHFSNPFFYSDYTHKRFFGLYTFYYFAKKEHQLARSVPNFYSDVRIRILSKKLVFKSPFRGRNIFKKIVQGVVNLSGYTQEFYEENLCFLVPCYGLRIVITADEE